MYIIVWKEYRSTNKKRTSVSKTEAYTKKEGKEEKENEKELELNNYPPLTF